jgi:hypothetical protein
LTKDQIPCFETVRGRVAAGYAHAKILGASAAEGWDIVRHYGGAFPVDRVTRLQKVGVRFGCVGCFLVGIILCLRERLK